MLIVPIVLTDVKRTPILKIKPSIAALRGRKLFPVFMKIPLLDPTKLLSTEF
jgi:hypothetical protein